MAMQFTPDEAATLKATAARHGKALEKLTGDVEALGRGLARVLTQLSETPPQATGGDEKKDPVRDWWMFRSGEAAVELLESLEKWMNGALLVRPGVLAGRHVTLPLPTCWRWHPGVVSDLITLQDQDAATFSQDSEVAVADYYGRWLPNALQRIGVELRACVGKTGTRKHIQPLLNRHGEWSTTGHEVELDATAWRDYARWWAANSDDRDPAHAPGLTVIYPTRNGARS